MAFAAPALPVIAIGLGILGAVVNTSATIASNNYQAEVARRQQAIMEQNAVNAIQRSQQEQIQQDNLTRALLGEQIAAQSASGLKLGGKSQVLTRKSARELGRLDALNIRNAGEIEAYNFRVSAEDARQKAQFLQQSNIFALLGGVLDAGSSVVGGLRTTPTSQLSSIFGPRRTTLSIGQKTSGLKFAR